MGHGRYFRPKSLSSYLGASQRGVKTRVTAVQSLVERKVKFDFFLGQTLVPIVRFTFRRWRWAGGLSWGISRSVGRFWLGVNIATSTLRVGALTLNYQSWLPIIN